MDMPPIHMCAFLNHENERLKTKIINLKKHINHLEKIIAQKNLDHIHSCSISCQTDIHPVRLKLPANEENHHLHHLLKAQNDLLKKYENENEINREDFVSKGLINNYEQRLNQYKKEKEQAEKRAIIAEQQMEKFEQRYQRMKKEIGSLDENFFEEIEDLKYALQQANNLNNEYEKAVQILSTRLGISYPTIIKRKK